MSQGSSTTMVAVENLLQNPQTAENLDKLLSRTDELLAVLDMLESFLKRGPEYANNINALVAQLRKLGVGSNEIVDLEKNLDRLKFLAQSESLQKLEARVTDPKIADSILSLLENLPEITQSIDMLVAALKRGPEYADNVNGLLQKLRHSLDESGASLKENLQSLNLPALRNAAISLSNVMQMPEMQRMLNSQIFGNEAITLVDTAAKAAIDASIEARQSKQKIGIFAMLGMLKDPDIQTTLRFAFGFAKKFGRELSQDARAIDSKKPD